MTDGPRRSALERARQLGWTIHSRLPEVDPDTDTDTTRVELLGEVFGLLVELDNRSLETWATALRSRGGR